MSGWIWSSRVEARRVEGGGEGEEEEGRKPNRGDWGGVYIV